MVVDPEVIQVGTERMRMRLHWRCTKEDVLKTMRERVAKFNVEKIRPQDLAGAAGPPDEHA